MPAGKPEPTKAIAKLEDCYQEVILPALPDVLQQALVTPTPKQFIKTRPGKGGRNFIYVDIGYVTMLLNKYFKGVWSFEIVDEERIGRFIKVRGFIEVPLSKDVKIRKFQYGSAEIKFFTKIVNGEKISDLDRPLDIGNDYKSAASSCLKKCASEFGICLDIFYPDVFNDTMKLKGNMKAGVSAPQKGGAAEDPMGAPDYDTGEVLQSDVI